MLKEFIGEYNNNNNCRRNSVRDIIEDFAFNITDTIDNELIELQSLVDSGELSNKEISDRISEIRALVY